MMPKNLSFILLSLFAIGNTSPLPTDSIKAQISHKLFGGGFTVGARIFNPTQINSFISDIYGALPIQPAEVLFEQSNTGLFWGIIGRGKIAYYPTPYFAFDGVIHLSVSPKWLYLDNLSGGSDRSANIYLWDIGGGLNSLMRIKPNNRACPKVGFGALFCNSILNVSGDVGTSRLAGVGIIWQVLGGLDVSISRFMVNIDICVPFCNYSFSSKNDDLDPNAIFRIPNRVEYFGIEFRPGFTYRF